MNIRLLSFFVFMAGLWLVSEALNAQQYDLRTKFGGAPIVNGDGRTVNLGSGDRVEFLGYVQRGSWSTAKVRVIKGPGAGSDVYLSREQFDASWAKEPAPLTQAGSRQNENRTAGSTGAHAGHSASGQEGGGAQTVGSSAAGFGVGGASSTTRLSGSSPTGMEFPACNAQNSYLNRELDQAFARSQSAFGISLEQALADPVSKCIQAGLSMPLSGHKGNFKCDRPNRQLASLPKRPSPCASKELVATTAMEMKHAARCFGVDLKEVMPLFLHESRFRPNAVSVTYAGGTGQLTRSAIAEVNQSRDRIRQSLPKQGCEFAAQALSQPMWDKDTCARMMIPESPRKNLLFSLAYYAHIRHSQANGANAKRELGKWPWFNSLDLASQEEIIREVTRAWYNGGPTMGRRVLRGVLSAAPSGFRSVQGFKKYYREKTSLSSAEAGSYAKKISQEGSLLDRKAGISCSI